MNQILHSLSKQCISSEPGKARIITVHTMENKIKERSPIGKLIVKQRKAEIIQITTQVIHQGKTIKIIGL